MRDAKEAPTRRPRRDAVPVVICAAMFAQAFAVFGLSVDWSDRAWPGNLVPRLPALFLPAQFFALFAWRLGRRAGAVLTLTPLVAVLTPVLPNRPERLGEGVRGVGAGVRPAGDVSVSIHVDLAQPHGANGTSSRHAAGGGYVGIADLRDLACVKLNREHTGRGLLAGTGMLPDAVQRCAVLRQPLGPAELDVSRT